MGRPSVSLDDIRRFRQLDSKAPGHPEYHWVSGVETTTGPLGQGVATSVGMAIGQKWLASHFNQPGFDVFDHHIYTVCGDGDMMEGIGSEAASLAGHLGLDTYAGEHNSNCHIQTAFPPNSLETAEHLSKLTGQTTIIKEQVTRSGRGLGTQVSRTMQEVRRPLLTPDECQRMPGPQKDGHDRITAAEGHGDLLRRFPGDLRPAASLF